MDSHNFCVIDTLGFYQTIVVTEFVPDMSGELTEQTIGYSLKEDETLLKAPLPAFKPHSDADGFIRPCWDGETWTEGATLEEAAAWQAEHPAPPIPPALPAVSDRISFIETMVLDLDYRQTLTEAGMSDLGGSERV